MSEVSGGEMPTVGDFARIFRHIQAEIHKVIVGHERTIEAVNGILDSRHPLIDKPVHPADK